VKEWGSNSAKEHTARKASGEYSRISASGSANSAIFCRQPPQGEQSALPVAITATSISLRLSPLIILINLSGSNHTISH
jgi:hypothetical protein